MIGLRSLLSCRIVFLCVFVAATTHPPAKGQEPKPKASLDALPDRQEPAPPEEKIAPRSLTADQERLIRLESDLQTTRDAIRKQLTDTTKNLEMVVLTAELDWKKAILARERAGYALREYEEGQFQQDQETMKGEIFLAKDLLERSRDLLKKLREEKAGAKPINRNLMTAQELTVQQEEFEVERAETALLVLEKYEAPKQISRLKSNISEARAEELKKYAQYLLQSNQLERRKNQSARLNARTPEDLVVALLDEVVEKETKLVALSREIQEINERVANDPEHAANLLEQVKAKRAELKTAVEEIKSTLLDATTIAEETRQLRIQLAKSERLLLFERRIPKPAP